MLLKIEFAGSSYYACGTSGLEPGAGEIGAVATSSTVAGAPCVRVNDLQTALQLPIDPNASVALDVGVLMAMLVVLRLLVYTTLRSKTKAG